MEAAKKESITTGGGLSYIADKAGTSQHTVRKWLKKLGLSFTKKEVASYTDAWNKNLPKELQPRFGKHTTEKTREKQRNSSRKYEDCNLYKHGGGNSWRKQVAAWARGFKLELFNKQNGVCAISGEPLDYDTCQVDHKEPVFKAPHLAFSAENLQLVSKNEHYKKTAAESKESRQVPKFSPVVSVEYVGEVQTYDIEVDHDSHNYVADGIVTHNSQRYAEVIQDMFCYREARLQDSKNRQNSIEVDDPELHVEWRKRQKEVLDVCLRNYYWALDSGIAKESARVVLPEGNTMSAMYVNFNVRSLVHWMGLRSGNGTQKEHIDVARKAMDACAPLFPNSWGALSSAAS